MAKDATNRGGGGGGGGGGVNDDDDGAAAAITPPPPAVGTVVELRDLKARPDLNGARGVVITPYDPVTGRCGVRLLDDDGKSEGLNIRPANLAEDPPTYLAGVKVADLGGDMGRVTVAARDFNPGDTVLSEPPVLVFEEGRGCFGLFDAYCGQRTSDADRDAIMDMHHPPLDLEPDAPDDDSGDDDDGGGGGGESQSSADYDGSSSASAARKQLRARVAIVDDEYRRYRRRNPAACRTLLPTPESARRLALIVSANAHGFRSISTGALVTTYANLPRESMALFVLGCKTEHSCSPNLTYGIRNGKLLYVAETYVRKGDRMSISYMGRGFEAAREERRGWLRDNKGFLCECQRCTGLDECRPVWCQCGASVMLMDGGGRGGKGERWRCLSCDRAASMDEAPGDVGYYIASRLKAEDGLVRRIRGFKLRLQYGGLDINMIAQMVDLQAEITDKLHPLHWLHAMSYTVMSSLAASGARMLMQDGLPPSSPKVRKLLYLSALSLLRHFVWLERNVSIVRGTLSVDDAVASVQYPPPNANSRSRKKKKQPTSSSSSSPGARIEDVSRVIACLCETPRDPGSESFGSVSHSIFHAGQDLLLAGHGELVARLYGRYAPLFEQWISLSDDNRERIRVLLRSGGKENPFGNHLMG